MLTVTAAILAFTVQAEPTREPPTPYDEARFTPLNPAAPNGPAIAVLRGDPRTGLSDMLMRFGPAEPVMHIHTADYRLVVLSGEMKHWTPEVREEDAAVLGPGSYWMQQGGKPHADRCLSETCVMFISWSGARDGRLASAQ
ncbi:DUF4437 domain-containing protein [Brevundimonas sp.]|uniref:DUF4437 domain-containing protein n=1 Tax=Brevundimonas sp. TaxID=1871086 RepID=UPI00273800A7|nr:DUF4437 domain-containing protein [Brevundimonas sp.]MDP3803654.1 DUF4437 domain-containing protein [Brevundimonas sp.]